MFIHLIVQISGSSQERLEHLQKMIRPFILRRLKKEVLKDLPDKIEKNMMARMEQEVIAAFVRMALSKLKGRSERLAIADEVLRLVAEEEGKAEPDPVVFHNGCLLLYDLHCEAEFSQYADRYGTLIEQAYGLDEKGLADMKKTLSAGP